MYIKIGNQTRQTVRRGGFKKMVAQGTWKPWSGPLVPGMGDEGTKKKIAYRKVMLGLRK